MLHLFRKIYLEHDVNIDFNRDRVVVSEKCGVSNWSELEKISTGELISYGTDLNSLNNISSFLELLNKIKQKTILTNNPVYIYADKKNYYKILSLWYKIILPNATVNDVVNYVKIIFDYKNFWKISRWWNMIDKSITTDVVFDSELLISEYNSLTINRGDYTNFINENVSTFNIELLLSSYLYNGSRKEELKKIILPFLRSEVTRSLYGMREVLTYHLVNSKFLKKIGITDTYNIGNLLDVLKNKNSIIQTFYNNNSVWKISMLDHDCYGFLLNIGSQSMISFKDITDNDISNIRKFLADIGISETDSVGIEWNYLLDLIPLIKADTITDNQLNDIIVHQSSQESCVTTCTFYSVSFPTVNTYFIQYILNQNNENNTKILAPYVI
jgi:hypothetical protein